MKLCVKKIWKMSFLLEICNNNNKSNGRFPLPMSPARTFLIFTFFIFLSELPWLRLQFVVMCVFESVFFFLYHFFSAADCIFCSLLLFSLIQMTIKMKRRHNKKYERHSIILGGQKGWKLKCRQQQKRKNI